MPVCHTVPVNGKTLIAGDGVDTGWNYPTTNTEKEWNISAGGFPSPPVLYSYGYTGSSPNAWTQATVTGTTAMNAGALYGSGGSLNGKSLIINLNQAGSQTLTFVGTGNSLNEANMLAAVGTKWPAIVVTTNGSNQLVLSDSTPGSIVIGSGTANAALGLTSGTDVVGGTDQDSTGDKFAYAGAYPDGTVYMTHGAIADPAWYSFAAPSNLYAPSAASTLISITNWPNNVQAITPRFSPLGTALAFGFWSGNTLPKSPSGTVSSDSTGKTLTVVDFTCTPAPLAPCTGGYAISNARAVTTSSTPGNIVAWPSFYPDGSAVLYQNQIVNSNIVMGWDPSQINTVGGAQANIWISDVPATSATAATPIRLNELNGLNSSGVSYLPTKFRTVSTPTSTGTGVGAPAAYPANGYHYPGNSFTLADGSNCSVTGTATNVSDNTLNYLPSVNPTSAGGYNWVVFTSRRMYGNIAYSNPWDASGQACDTGLGAPTKKLWMAALDSPYTPGTDPSHPAFYLPGQETAAGNSNGYWVNSPCVAVNGTCEADGDCCGGGSTTKCTYTGASTTTCQNISVACVAANGVCSVPASPGNCCTGLVCPGVGGTCTAPIGLAYRTSTYTRQFVASCPAQTNVQWELFEWQATIPTGTSIGFAAQTMLTATSTYAPTTPLSIGTASSTTGTGVWAHAAQTVDQVFQAATPGLISEPYLLVTITFNPNGAGTVTPTLVGWEQNYDCVPSE